MWYVTSVIFQDPSTVLVFTHFYTFLCRIFMTFFSYNVTMTLKPRYIFWFLILQCLVIVEIKRLVEPCASEISAKDLPKTIVSTGTKVEMKNLVNPYNFKFITTCPHVCSESRIYLVIFVHSSLEHFMKRNIIRDTWASLKEYHNKHIATVFLLGQSQNASLQGLINAEIDKHKDIVQGIFIDTYRNMTLKHLMGLKWVTQFCSQSKFVLKVDDDTFVNTIRLIHFLERHVDETGSVTLRNAIYCRTLEGAVPERNHSSKHFVTLKEYSASFYPTYCSGLAYVTTTEVVTQLHKFSPMPKFFWIDDIYVTGMLAEKINVVRTRPTIPFGFSMDLKRRAVFKYLVIYNDQEEDVEGIWKELWSTIRMKFARFE